MGERPPRMTLFLSWHALLLTSWTYISGGSQSWKLGGVILTHQHMKKRVIVFVHSVSCLQVFGIQPTQPRLHVAYSFESFKGKRTARSEQCTSTRIVLASMTQSVRAFFLYRSRFSIPFLAWPQLHHSVSTNSNLLRWGSKLSGGDGGIRRPT